MAYIHIFNPETEIILGLNRVAYTPNRRVEHFKKRLSLLPALYASKGDIILTEGIKESDISLLPFYDIALMKEITILPFESPLQKIFKNIENFSFCPWGWNKAIVHKLRNKIKDSALPSDFDIQNIRRLAHREQTVIFFNNWRHSILKQYTSPEIIDSAPKLISFLESRNEYCLKAPWSSSGRGVIFSSELTKEEAYKSALTWINTQGAAMGEPLYDVKHNLASEWYVNPEGVKFIGFSFFKTSSSGKYLGNLLLPQKEIETIISESSNISVSTLLKMQREHIVDNIAGNYCGPLGFDMLITSDGILNPCVEINLRQTMGHVAIEIKRQLDDTSQSRLASRFSQLFSSSIFSAIEFI